jgi:cardiolipin synthase C
LAAAEDDAGLRLRGPSVAGGQDSDNGADQCVDPTIAALDGRPNIEVRLYDPNVQRGVRALNFVNDFTRANHRMHNKSFTVDNQVAVVGGRNIGDEYFGAGSGVVFADFDVAVVGAVVPQVSQEFDTYWNSASAYPAAAFVGSPGTEGTQALQARFAANNAVPDSLAYIAAVKASPLLRDITARKVAFEWTTAKLPGAGTSGPWAIRVDRVHFDSAASDANDPAPNTPCAPSTACWSAH